MAHIETSEPPQPYGSHPRSSGGGSLFFIGKDSRGNWVARDRAGSCGGLFVSRSEAIRFALGENGSQPVAIVMVPGVLELTAGRPATQPGRA